MSKRIFDFLGALVGILVLSPVLVALSLLVKSTSKGPVLYRGIRVGLHGEPFRIYKFRTMVVDAEKIGGPSTARNDPRVTPIGKFLRRHKLDELPQLVNILTGEMSFVGPRPQVERYTKLYKGDETMILSVRPGLTDYASVHFADMDSTLGDGDVDSKYATEVEPYKNMLRLKYVRERSFLVDMKILCQTLVRLLRG